MSDKQTSNYYRKSAFVIRIARYVVTVLLLLFLISCILVFRNDITVDNIRLLAKFISLNDGSSDLYEHPFSVNTSKDTRAIMLRDNLALIDKGNISLHYLSGQKLFSFNYAFANPAVAYNDHNILVYDINGTELSVFSSFSKITTEKFDNSIKCADIATDHYAVVTDYPSYKSALTVYEYNFSKNDYSEKFKYLSSSSYITTLSLNSDGSEVACAFVKSEQGSYSTHISVFNVNSGSTTPSHSVDINGELPIKLGYSKDDGFVYVITDSAIHFYDSSLNKVSSHKFNQSKVMDYFENDSLIIFTEKNNLTGVSMTLNCFDKSGQELFTTSVDDQISDIAFGKNKIFALGESSVFEITNSDGNGYNVTGKQRLDSKYYSIVVDTKDNAYIINNISAEKITFK